MTLIHILCFSHYPYIIPVYMKILLIYYFCRNYVIKTIVRSRNKKYDIDDLNPILVGLVNKILSITSIEELLQTVQNTIYIVNENIRTCKNIVEWKDRQLTKKVFMFLVLLTLYSLFYSIPMRYVSAITGTYVLCMNTKPFQTITWGINGLISYMSKKSRFVK